MGYADAAIGTNYVTLFSLKPGITGGLSIYGGTSKQGCLVSAPAGKFLLLKSTTASMYGGARVSQNAD